MEATPLPVSDLWFYDVQDDNNTWPDVLFSVLQDPPAAAGQTLVAALRRLANGISSGTLVIHLCPRLAMTAEPPACQPIRYWAVATPASNSSPKVGVSLQHLASFRIHKVEEM